MMIQAYQTIGIIGGGQLGQMLTIAAKSMGFYVIILDPTPNCCASQVADGHIVAAYADEEALGRLAQQSDVITYEFENIPAQAIEQLSKQAYLPQGAKPLALTQHRLQEKQALQTLGIPVAPFIGVQTQEQLLEAVAQLGYPAILKTCRGGYDGKGQVVLRSEADIVEAAKLLPNDCVLEAFVYFDYEASIIVTRSVHGEMTTFPIAQNIHRNQTLACSIVPSQCSKEVEQTIQAFAQTLSLIHI